MKITEADRDKHTERQVNQRLSDEFEVLSGREQLEIERSREISTSN